MRVKMLSTRKGSPDGIEAILYKQGEEYEIHGDLLDVFLKEGWCEAVEPFREGEDNGEASKPLADASGTESAEASGDGEAAKVADPAGSAENPTGEGASAAGGNGQPGGEGESADGTKETELVLAEADVLAKYTRDELLDLAEEQGIEVPENITKKADVVKFLAGKLKVTVEQE